MTAGVARRSAWDAIVQRALLGTERAAASAAPVADRDLGALFARLDSSDAERTLLAGAALIGAYEAAGRLPGRAPAPSFEPAPLESVDQPPVPPRVARFLATMLGGVHTDVLHEWVDAVAAKGWRVPTPLLPALLEAGRNMTIAANIATILGARGRWLAARNDAWRYGTSTGFPSDDVLRTMWETGTLEARVVVLAGLRRHRPASGRSLLESTWETEAPAQRANLLGLLRENITLDDEAFLEQRLDDRRQDVRTIAALLLQLLPASALVARMTERARAALTWKPGKLLKRAEISVEPPVELDAILARDGIEKKPPPGMGERAWWLTQIIASIPPSVWSDGWKVPPAAAISAAAGGDWAAVLLEGWSTAAETHRDIAWLEAFVARGDPGVRVTQRAPRLRGMVIALPVERREAVIAKALRDGPSADHVVDLISGAYHPWSDVFAHVVLPFIRMRVASAAAVSTADSDRKLRALLPELALRVPPSLSSATEGWATGDDAGEWARPLERFISTLTFRRELHEELER